MRCVGPDRFNLLGRPHRLKFDMTAVSDHNFLNIDAEELIPWKEPIFPSFPLLNYHGL